MRIFGPRPPYDSLPDLYRILTHAINYDLHFFFARLSTRPLKSRRHVGVVAAAAAENLTRAARLQRREQKVARQEFTFFSSQ